MFVLIYFFLNILVHFRFYIVVNLSNRQHTEQPQLPSSTTPKPSKVCPRPKPTVSIPYQVVNRPSLSSLPEASCIPPTRSRVEELPHPRVTIQHKVSPPVWGWCPLNNLLASSSSQDSPRSFTNPPWTSPPVLPTRVYQYFISPRCTRVGVPLLIMALP